VNSQGRQPLVQDYESGSWRTACRPSGARVLPPAGPGPGAGAPGYSPPPLRGSKRRGAITSDQLGYYRLNKRVVDLSCRSLFAGCRHYGQKKGRFVPGWGGKPRPEPGPPRPPLSAGSGEVGSCARGAARAAAPVVTPVLWPCGNVTRKNRPKSWKGWRLSRRSNMATWVSERPGWPADSGATTTRPPRPSRERPGDVTRSPPGADAPGAPTGRFSAAPRRARARC
jgi:hypothetical protein